MVAFPVYMDHQLRFLDQSTEIGRMVSKSIVQTTIDDDCATDDEIQDSSQRSLARELHLSITKYTNYEASHNIRAINKYVKNS